MEGALVWKIATILFSLPILANADAPNAEWLSTTRSLSMGNVGIASADDPATAMFYNPAALGRVKKTSVEIFNPQIEFGTGVFRASRSSSSLGKNFGLTSIKPALIQSPFTPSYLGASLYPNITAQNFAFGILAQSQAVSYYNPRTMRIVYQSRYLLMPTMGISLGLLGGRFRLGAAFRAIQITENDKQAALSQGSIGYRMDAAEGFGFGVDVGTLISLPVPGLPTLGFVARNLGDTMFPSEAPSGFATGTVTRHDKVPMTYDASFALFPKLAQRSVFTIAADYRDVTNVTNTDFARRLNFGIEMNLSRVLFLRAGMTRGYWSAGFGLSSKHGSLDIGTYSEELHPTRYNDLEDRRISIRYGSRF